MRRPHYTAHHVQQFEKVCLDDRWAAWHVLSSKLDVLSGQPGLPQTSNRCPAKYLRMQAV